MRLHISIQSRQCEDTEKKAYLFYLGLKSFYMSYKKEYFLKSTFINKHYVEIK